MMTRLARIETLAEVFQSQMRMAAETQRLIESETRTAQIVAAACRFVAVVEAGDDWSESYAALRSAAPPGGQEEREG